MNKGRAQPRAQLAGHDRPGDVDELRHTRAARCTNLRGALRGAVQSDATVRGEKRANTTKMEELVQRGIVGFSRSEVTMNVDLQVE